MPSSRQREPEPEPGYGRCDVALSILKFVAVVGVVMCCAANIIAMDNAVQDTWFVPCSQCKGYGGEKDCVKCCKAGCTLRKEAFFYILRLYSIAFCVLSVVAMLPSRIGRLTFRWTWRYFRGLKGYIGRGLLQVFIGFLTVESNFFDDESDSEKYADGVGYAVMGLGAVQMLLGCMCVSEEAPDFEADDDEELAPPVSRIGSQPTSPPRQLSAQPAQAPPRKPKVESVSERLAREQREMDEAMAADRARMGDYYASSGPSARDREDAELKARYYTAPPKKTEAPLPPSEGPPPPASACGRPPTPTPQPPAAAPPRADVDDDVARRRAQDDADLDAAYYGRR